MFLHRIICAVVFMQTSWNTRSGQITKSHFLVGWPGCAGAYNPAYICQRLLFSIIAISSSSIAFFNSANSAKLAPGPTFGLKQDDDDRRHLRNQSSRPASPCRPRCHLPELKAVKYFELPSDNRMVRPLTYDYGRCHQRESESDDSWTLPSLVPRPKWDGEPD